MATSLLIFVENIGRLQKLFCPSVIPISLEMLEDVKCFLGLDDWVRVFASDFLETNKKAKAWKMIALLNMAILEASMLDLCEKKTTKHFLSSEIGS